MTEEAAAALLQYMARRHAFEREEAIFLMKTAGGLYPKKRHAYQAALVQRTLEQAAELVNACGWSGVAVLKDGQVLVDQDGVLFRGDVDNRLFKKRGDSAGRGMLAHLRAAGIEPRTVLDIGANFGEVAIYFASRLPGARVVAFEPGLENLAAFERNLAEQRSPLTNLELIREAVSDRAGDIEFTMGGGDLSTVMVDGGLQRLKRRKIDIVKVKTNSLENYCRNLGIDSIDFMKIDIEGAEPLLSESIGNMQGRIASAHVEISRYNSIDAYVALIAAFARAGLTMLDKGVAIEQPAEWLSRRLEKAPAVNVWFLRQGLETTRGERA